MKVNQIALDERLRNLAEGQASDPVFDVQAVIAFSSVKVGVYLSGFEDEIRRLGLLVHMSEAAVRELSYQELAVKIDRLYRADGGRKSADEAMHMLAKPFLKFYSMRRERR